MLSRSAGSGSPKGQDGLNYWLHCNSALRLVIISQPSPNPPGFSTPTGQGGEGPGEPSSHHGPGEGRQEGVLPWAPGLLVQPTAVAKVARTHSSVGQQSWVSKSSLPSLQILFPRGPHAPALLSCPLACKGGGVQGGQPTSSRAWGTGSGPGPSLLPTARAWGRRAALRQRISHFSLGALARWGKGNKAYLQGGR